MRQGEGLEVWIDQKKVGLLALTADHKVAFSYCDTWLEEGFSISPFSLPLKKQVFVPEKNYFGGLFGVFADSLPDAWGRLLLERLLREHGKDVGDYTMLDRLAIVGNSGMGALTYRPQYEFPGAQEEMDLDELAEQCQKILLTEYAEKLDELYQLGGTSGGARPKIMTQIDGEDWIIKFPAHVDQKDSGEMEYAYSLCAKECGIVMSQTRLFPSDLCSGYFGTKRFDRVVENGMIQKKHVLTAAALLELDYEQPRLDYHALMKLTKILTWDDTQDIENMYRRMCFNVYAHNRDDHSKNFSFIYDEKEDKWHLSPAYDLTYSNTYYGEHTTTVDGNGKNPGKQELLACGMQAGMSKKRCQSIADEIEERVAVKLKKYLQ